MTWFACLFDVLIMLGWIIEVLDSDRGRVNRTQQPSPREVEEWMEQNPIHSYAMLNFLDGDFDGRIDFDPGEERPGD